ncbi:allatostatin C precursor [Bombyx mori]|uniref:Allatostatin C n=1 Tax=Bombyx mori TaxID=7091 RepID=B3IWA9_BOMMO|nr:allatostatin C precursor [Bombyx mori]BAG49566.1 allatostatin C precursor [Bombyx mori]BAG68396.1 allatostatin C [Bombyx mori]
MKFIRNNLGLAVLFGVFALLVVTNSAPMDPDEDQSESSVVGHTDNEVDLSGSWDAVDAAALRKLLTDLGVEDRMNRVARSWPQATEPRGWAMRNVDGRLVRPWRADKRQVRFRQCYFNPISCFRK